MNYSETLRRIHSLNKFGSRPGLDRVRMLLDMMDNPQDGLRFLHVAGTNGKGSTCAMVSSVLRSAGYKTGLFISPFITDFCERIQIDNTPISHEDLCEVAGYCFSFVEKLNRQGIIITEFEFVMSVAFEYFKRQGCDIVVLEVGLGGTLDCTNVIKPPECAVITRIGLDHTDILGNSFESVAAQKCGIIKEGTPVVSSPQRVQAQKVIENTCREKNVPLVFSNPELLKVTVDSVEGTQFTYNGKEYRINLTGEHQIQNASTALCVIETLREKGYGISDENIREGLLTAVNPARFELICSAPAVIIDGAHNPDGVSAFAKSVRKYFGEKKGVLIIGMLSDKDSRASVEYLKGLFQKAYTVPINNPRAESPERMAEICSAYFEDVEVTGSAEEAFRKALALAKTQGTFLCVCGSLYLAGEIRPYGIKCCKELQGE